MLDVRELVAKKQRYVILPSVDRATGAGPLFEDPLPRITRYSRLLVSPNKPAIKLINWSTAPFTLMY